ncbi:MAG: hypothetical protein KF866_04195 [Phycisphaeraceae bacterium]|nr:hypothetical protein [Phycisphaeraceae bacterium]
MTIDHDEQVERDDLAPARRLHIIAEILAEGVRRRREDARRRGDPSDILAPPEREEDGLEPSGPVRLDRPLG